MTEQNYTDLSQVVTQIEERNEYKEIELRNELRLKLEAQARKRIIFIWLPIVGFGIIILIWMIANIPDYEGCIKSCLSKTKEITVHSRDDCQFYCNIKFGN